jgi:ABC-2 type transport system permease protein
MSSRGARSVASAARRGRWNGSSAQRVCAMMLRYWYLLRSSWPRLLDLVYWPTVQMVTWGFLQYYIANNAGFFARAGGTFIGAVLLWDILFRGQLGFSISFLEEMWSRNIGNLMMSPLRPFEFITALMVMSVVRLSIGAVPVTFLAIAFFGFNLYGLGLALVAFFFNLMLTSWAIGIFVSGLILRNGMGAENLAWSIMFLFMPLTCVYYPVTTLPEWLQPVAWVLPPTYVFEGMRALLTQQNFRPDLMLDALGLNVVYFAGGVFAFLKLLQSARRHGSLMQSGE